MGWQDYHLHEFRVLSGERGELVLLGIPDDEGFEDAREVLPGWEVAFVEYCSQPGDQAGYEYDFGDSWIHEVTLVGVEPRVKGQRYPQCTRLQIEMTLSAVTPQAALRAKKPRTVWT